MDDDLKRAAAAIASADALLIGAGAGMGVDSGLPDFRGPEGFWKAYPPFRGRQFHEISNPLWFTRDPNMAWGFFGHRLGLYRAAQPHAGFEILRRWGDQKPGGCFVFTSNVDGQFHKAGFDPARIVECHGSIHHLQCVENCTPDIWPTGDLAVDVDLATIRATSPLPDCRECYALARPNILMFGDYRWNDARTAEQIGRYDAWREGLEGKRIVAIELGAGTAIPTVRMECEAYGEVLVRINPRDPDVEGRDQIGLPLGAREGLERLAALVG